MPTTSPPDKPASTLELCAGFGPYARILPPLFDYSAAKTFAGPATILKVSAGREKLNIELVKSCAEHVVVIDGRHLDPLAVAGPQEVANAITGKCRALLVFGCVYDIAKLGKEKTLPVYALDNSPRVLRAEGGRVEPGYLDCAAGLTEAAEALRMLIEKIVLTPGPERGEVFATLHGELGTILEWTERQAIGKTAKTTNPASG